MKSDADSWIALAMFVVGFALLAGLCCTPPEPVTPPPTGDACVDMCTTGARLGCVWAQATPEGASCVEVCERTESSGWTSVHPACVARAQSCDEADRLSMRGCP